MTVDLRAVALSLALAATPLGSAAQTPAVPPGHAPTLEQVLAAPYASDLTAAPAGGGVAWVLLVKGVRNVWAAAPPDYRARQLTAYSADDGQEIGGLAWTPDGRSVVYVRGGEANGHGESPNPTSDPAGAEQALWIVSASGGPPRRLGEGRWPAVSPRGDRVAFVKGGQVWSVALRDKAVPIQLLHARGAADTLRWSPDGRFLAFVSERDDHSFIGVYDVAAKALRYLDPSVDQDVAPSWSPDGRAIAFVRVPTAPKALPFVPRRAGPPWSIRVADPATGQGRQVWRAREGKGSVFYFLDSPDQLLWATGAAGSDPRLVFPWEADGWCHLYSVAVAAGGAGGAGEALLLTPGEFEVENATLAARRREVLFASNQDDIDRRHLWRVAAAGPGRPAALTAGAGIEWSPVATSDGGSVAILRSDARASGRAAILPATASVSRGGEPRDLAPQSVPAEFPAASPVVPQAVRFPAADGLAIHGQLFLPPGLAPGERRPAVIFFHGGSVRQMLLGWHYMRYYHNSYGFNQYLASRGFVVLSVNYRSGIGYGMEFREALHFGANGASEFADVLGAGLYLKGRPDVIPERIGLWGGSYGGYLTALGLARASGLFAAGVDFHGVHDWNTTIPDFAHSYDPATRTEVARRAFESSPLSAVKDWRSPVLLIHGDDDRNVPFAETVSLVDALRAQGMEPEQLIFPDEIHDLLRHASWLRAYRAAEDFLTRHLFAERR